MLIAYDHKENIYICSVDLREDSIVSALFPEFEIFAELYVLFESMSSLNMSHGSAKMRRNLFLFGNKCH